MHATGWLPSSVLGPGVVGRIATLGAVAAGAAIVEVALIPGLPNDDRLPTSLDAFGNGDLTLARE